MVRFIVAIFPDAASAHEGTDALKALAFEKTIRLHGAATVTKGDDGKLTMQVTAKDGPAATATGALIGGLAGLAIGPLAAAILAAGGAVFGASAALTNRGAGKAFAEQVAQDLVPGMTAVVAELTAEDLSIPISKLEAVGGAVTRHQALRED